jgi:hypothetical protein
MKVSDLIADFRDEADDTKKPQLWSDARLLRYADDAQREAARRARLFLDSDTPAITRVRIRAGTSVGALDPRVIYVRRSRVQGEDCMLVPTYRRDMDFCIGWEQESGTPSRIIRDWGSQRVKVYPMPVVDTTLVLQVIREPLATLESLDDELEIPARYQRGLVDWMLFRAYSKRDAGGDAAENKLALYYDARFTAEFGPMVSAINEVFEQQYEDVLSDLQGGSY